MGKVICINNQKGGNAKTTTTRELAYISAKQGFKTLEIDLDPQFSLTKSFGLTYKNVKGKAINNVFMDEINIQDVIIKTKYDNLYLLPSSKDLSMLDVDLAIKYETKLLYNHLRRILEPVRDDYDLIFIDVLPSLGMTSLNALCVSDWLLIPCVTEEACLTQLEDLMEVALKVKTKLNTSLKYLGILPVMVDKRTGHHVKCLDALNNFYSNRYHIDVFKDYIGTCTSFRDSVSLLEPASALYYDIPVLNYTKVFNVIKEKVGL